MEATANSEKYKQQLIKHVNQHYFIKQGEKPEQWEVKCWLGKEPTGRLFTVKQSRAETLNNSKNQLANDMWDFLYTPKGEEITRKEYEMNQTLDNFSQQMLHSAIQGINEATTQEKIKTNFWKRQAYILHSKDGHCREHNHITAIKDADLYFTLGGASCLKCPREENKKEVNHA